MNIPKKIIKRTRDVIKTDSGKNIQTSSYNRITGRSVSKEKDITDKTKAEPRTRYVEKQVVKRDKDGNWKSEKETRKLFTGGRKVKSDTTYTNYKKGGLIKKKK